MYFILYYIILYIILYYIIYYIILYIILYYIILYYIILYYIILYIYVFFIILYYIILYYIILYICAYVYIYIYMLMIFRANDSFTRIYPQILGVNSFLGSGALLRIATGWAVSSASSPISLSLCGTQRRNGRSDRWTGGPVERGTWNIRYQGWIRHTSQDLVQCDLRWLKSYKIMSIHKVRV